MESDELKSNLDQIYRELKGITDRRVRVVAVTKTHPPEIISRLLALGQIDIGENRQNEARDKFPLVHLPGEPDRKPIYHHLGPLQSGTARQIPGLFHWVHGVSSTSALDSLQKSVQNFKKSHPDANRQGELPIRYLIQVDYTDETTKAGGIKPEEVPYPEDLPHNEDLFFSGFMTMGPTSQNIDQTREVFLRMREFRDRVFPEGELSMGMSGDWKVAVEEGATIIRIGSAIVGQRNQSPWKIQG